MKATTAALAICCWSTAAALSIAQATPERASMLAQKLASRNALNFAEFGDPRIHHQDNGIDQYIWQNKNDEKLFILVITSEDIACVLYKEGKYRSHNKDCLDKNDFQY